MVICSYPCTPLVSVHTVYRGLVCQSSIARSSLNPILFSFKNLTLYNLPNTQGCPTSLRGIALGGIGCPLCIICCFSAALRLPCSTSCKNGPWTSIQLGVILFFNDSIEKGLKKISSASIQVIQSVLQASRHLWRARPGPVFLSQVKIVISKFGNLFFKKSYFLLSAGSSFAIIIAMSSTADWIWIDEIASIIWSSAWYAGIPTVISFFFFFFSLIIYFHLYYIKIF